MLKQECNLSKESAFLDIGSGLEKPNFHAAQEGVGISLGVELVNIRHFLLMKNLKNVIDRKCVMSSDSTSSDISPINVKGLNFINADIMKVQWLNPFTHIYQFDLGFEPELHNYIANLFNKRFVFIF